MTERVLVTGAAGFVGSHTCRALLRAGYAVVGMDNFDPFYDRRVKESALAGLRPEQGFAFVEGDIRDLDAAVEALADVAAVVHLAARPGVPQSMRDPGAYAAINVHGTARLLAACRRTGVRRLVFSSSSSVYGNAPRIPVREEAAVRPVSPYAASKCAGEVLCRRFARREGARVAILRLFSVYGPGQRPDLAIHRFTRLLAHGRTVPQYGDGSTQRDYTHVDDIVGGIVAALAWTAGRAAAFEVFNLADARAVRLDDLIALVAAALGITPTVRVLTPRAGDVGCTHGDITKARAVLGYAPRVVIEDGVAQFVHWYREGSWT